MGQQSRYEISGFYDIKGTKKELLGICTVIDDEVNVEIPKQGSLEGLLNIKDGSISLDLVGKLISHPQPIYFNLKKESQETGYSGAYSGSCTLLPQYDTHPHTYSGGIQKIISALVAIGLASNADKGKVKLILKTIAHYKKSSVA